MPNTPGNTESSNSHGFSKHEPQPVGMIYGIIDKVADMLISGLMVHKHDAPAVRFFTGLANNPQTIVAKHPEDFVLVRLGFLMDDHTIDEEKVLVLDGAVIKTVQNLPPKPEQTS